MSYRGRETSGTRFGRESIRHESAQAEREGNLATRSSPQRHRDAHASRSHQQHTLTQRVRQLHARQLL